MSGGWWDYYFVVGLWMVQKGGANEHSKADFTLDPLDLLLVVSKSKAKR